MKDYLSIIILFCFKQYSREKSLSAIYNLLVGKKTAQTIQDGKLYKLSFLFQTMSHLTKEELIEKALYLEQKELIHQTKEHFYIITDKGINVLLRNLPLYPLPKHLNGWKYHSCTKQFFDRLAIMIQTLSNLVHGSNRFIPIVKDEMILKQVKDLMLSSGKNKTVLSKQLHDELMRVLCNISDFEATIFTLKLTSYKRIGLTFTQISQLLNEDLYRTQILYVGAIHKSIDQILKNRREYPLLYALLKDIYQENPLTFSTKKTYQLLLQGKSLDEIARIRNLKRSTIEDHIVELAHNLEMFNINHFIDKKDRQKIVQTITRLKTNSLKEIKLALNDQASYFQIRLVLAKSGENDAT